MWKDDIRKKTIAKKTKIKYNRKEQWLAIIDGEDRGLIKMAKEKNEKIEEVEYQLHTLSEDEEIQRIEFLRLKAALDRNSDIGYAKRETTIEIAKKMKKKNISIEEIIEITGLSKEEIENL